MVRMMRGGRSGGFAGRGGRRDDEGPPEEIVEVGEVMHSCEGNQVICKATIEKVPYFNKYAYLENKAQLGKVDEVMGPTFSLVRCM
jgi:H/ACA ribonucleoprotein complex subunit 1